MHVTVVTEHDVSVWLCQDVATTCASGQRYKGEPSNPRGSPVERSNHNQTCKRDERLAKFQEIGQLLEMNVCVRWPWSDSVRLCSVAKWRDATWLSAVPGTFNISVVETVSIVSPAGNRPWMITCSPCSPWVRPSTPWSCDELRADPTILVLKVCAFYGLGIGKWLKWAPFGPFPTSTSKKLKKLGTSSEALIVSGWTPSSAGKRTSLWWVRPNYHRDSESSQSWLDGPCYVGLSKRGGIPIILNGETIGFACCMASWTSQVFDAWMVLQRHYPEISRWSRMLLPSWIDLHHFYPFLRKWIYLESIFLDSEVPWLRVFVSSCLWIRKLPQCRDASSRHFQDISMQLPEQAKQSRAQWRRMLSVRGSFPCEASISIEVSRSAALTYWSEPIGLVDATRTMSRLCRQPRCDLGLSSFRSRLNLDSCWAAAEPETCGTFHSVATWKSTPWISFSNLSDWLISKMNRANTFHQDFLWRIFDTRGKGLTTNSPRIGGNGKICIPLKKMLLKTLVSRRFCLQNQSNTSWTSRIYPRNIPLTIWYSVKYKNNLTHCTVYT